MKKWEDQGPEDQAAIYNVLLRSLIFGEPDPRLISAPGECLPPALRERIEKVRKLRPAQ